MEASKAGEIGSTQKKVLFMLDDIDVLSYLGRIELVWRPVPLRPGFIFVHELVSHLFHVLACF